MTFPDAETIKLCVAFEAWRKQWPEDFSRFVEDQYKPAPAEQPSPEPCPHINLNMEGYCKKCGEDCRGIGGSGFVKANPVAAVPADIVRLRKALGPEAAELSDEEIIKGAERTMRSAKSLDYRNGYEAGLIAAEDRQHREKTDVAAVPSEAARKAAEKMIELVSSERAGYQRMRLRGCSDLLWNSADRELMDTRCQEMVSIIALALTQHAADAVREERERCAKIVANWAKGMPGPYSLDVLHVTNAILTRIRSTAGAERPK